uniref:hypothetical protein n=1 Tax=Parerythrobacter lutipelagi TaxID=1964208 RepID=UPI0010F8DAE0|nr:hypothetical protein [Parerythrobacter lutipelagi]
MRLLALSLAAPALFLAPAALAGEPKENDQTSDAKAEKSEKICKYVVDGMGSRRKKRVCLTTQEWIDFNRGQ